MRLYLLQIILLTLLLINVYYLIAIFLDRCKRLHMCLINNVLLFLDGLRGGAFLDLPMVTIAARLDGRVFSGQRALPLKAFGRQAVQIGVVICLPNLVLSHV